MFSKIFILYFILTITHIRADFFNENFKANDTPKDISNQIFFLYYKGPTVNDFIRVTYKDGLSFSNNVEFNKKLKTVFYLHGWTEKPSANQESVDTIVSAFLSKKIVNLICVDYADLVKGNTVLNYVSAFSNVSDIGDALGYFLKQYVRHVQPVDKIHLIGHSLGSQIMSKTAQAYGKGKLPWLTALDPAGPLFNIPLIDHLSKEDGKFVDVIHTDGWAYGDGRSIGHVDFFPNFGVREQPYCAFSNSYEFCSHHMSWKYYAESILNENSFPAKKCELNLFCTGLNLKWCCNKNASISNMGYGVNKKARGDFYLKTNVSAPFDLGNDGFYF